MPFIRSYANGGGGGGGGVPFDVGVAVPSADIRAVLYVNGSGALETSADDGIIGATGVRIGYLLVAEHVADHTFLGHLDKNTSSTNYQIRLDPDGDTNVKAPGAGAALTLIGGDSGAGAINFFTNNASRWTINSSGHLIANTDNTFDIGVTAATRPRDIHLARNLGFASGQSVALGGGSAPTLGTIGGSGPATAGQSAWLKVLINNVSCFIPYWV